VIPAASQLGWRYMRNLAKVDPALGALVGQRDRQQWDRVQEGSARLTRESEWFLAMLEICAAIGLLNDGHPDIYQVRLAAKLITQSAHRGIDRPSWRAGLACDYLRRCGDSNVSERRNEQISGVTATVSEFLAIFDEFRASEPGRAYRSWISPAAGNGASWLRQRVTALGRRVVLGHGKRGLETVEGAKRLLDLVATAHGLLMDLAPHPEAQSVCWRMQADLFVAGDAPASAAIALLSSGRNYYLLRRLRNGQDDPNSEDDLSEEIERSMLRLRESEAHWQALSNPENWSIRSRAAMAAELIEAAHLMLSQFPVEGSESAANSAA
jgi:hypothetical protein